MPLCHFYNTARGCRNGTSCRFVHDNSSSTVIPAPRRVCKYYSSGTCRNGRACRFRHEDTVADLSGPSRIGELPPSGSTSNSPGVSKNGTKKSLDSAEGITDDCCSICYEKPDVYGLLREYLQGVDSAKTCELKRVTVSCSHVYCLECIREWRTGDKSSEEASSTDKSRCPVCREMSTYVIPSKRFLSQSDRNKWLVAEDFKANTGRGVCRYFQRSPENDRKCRDGRECRYQHRNADGSAHVFDHGAKDADERDGSDDYVEVVRLALIRARLSDWDIEFSDSEGDTWEDYLPGGRNDGVYGYYSD